VYDATDGIPEVAVVNHKNVVYSDLPYLSNIKLGGPEQEKREHLATLILPSMYYADVNYKMSVKMTDTNGHQTLWAQPVLITRDVFTNTFLNQ